MRIIRNGVVFVCVLAIIVSLILTGSRALAVDKFPSQPITLINSWAPGGSLDVIARALQPQIEKSLGQSLVITNKPGGGGSIGYNSIAESQPDGYTIGAVAASLSMLKYTQKSGVDFKRYEPIFFGAYTTATLAVKADAPWKTLREFLDYAKANPGKLRIANPSYGATFHLHAIAIERASGVSFTHVPFKGSSQAIPAVMGGHVDAISHGFADTLQFVKAGELRYIAVSAPERSKYAPDVQTFKELGLDVIIYQWYGWCGPRGIPQDRVQMLHNAFKAAARTKEFEKFCEEQGLTVLIKSPKEFGEYLEQEDKKYRELIEVGGIKPQ